MISLKQKIKATINKQFEIKQELKMIDKKSNLDVQKQNLLFELGIIKNTIGLMFWFVIFSKIIVLSLQLSHKYYF